MYKLIRLPHELTEAKRESYSLLFSHSRQILDVEFNTLVFPSSPRILTLM